MLGLRSQLSSIGKLVHLRYLCLGKNYGMKALSKSICRLLNLQYLQLFCPVLGVFPKDFENLMNLRFLALSSKLWCITPDKVIGKLASLGALSISLSPELTSISEGIWHLTILRNMGLDGCPKLVLCLLAWDASLRLKNCKFKIVKISISRKMIFQGLLGSRY